MARISRIKYRHGRAIVDGGSMFVNIRMKRTPTVTDRNKMEEISFQFVERRRRVTSAPRKEDANRPYGPTNRTARRVI
jgi:hypothetical protein